MSEANQATLGEHPLLGRVRAARHGSAVGRFVAAFTLPMRAARFLAARRALWPLVLVPALINIVLFAGALWFVLGGADDLLGTWWAKPALETWIDWLWRGLWYVAWLVALVLGVVLAYVGVLLVGGIVASPFNDALSERTETALTGRAEVPQPGETFLGGVLRSVGSAIAITAIYGVLVGPVLLLNLVPVLGSVAATILGVLLGGFFVALEYADTVFGRYGLSLGEKFRLLRADKALAFGFGLGASLLLMIPLLNFLVIPIAVVGGTAIGLVLVGDRS